MPRPRQRKLLPRLHSRKLLRKLPRGKLRRRPRPLLKLPDKLKLKPKRRLLPLLLPRHRLRQMQEKLLRRKLQLRRRQRKRQPRLKLLEPLLSVSKLELRPSRRLLPLLLQQKRRDSKISPLHRNKWKSKLQKPRLKLRLLDWQKNRSSERRKPRRPLQLKRKGRDKRKLLKLLLLPK